MTAGPILLRDLHRVWHELWPLLEPAVKRSPDKPDVLARLIARDAQLWAVYDGDKPIAAVVTKVQDCDEGRRCLLWLIGGSRARAWADDFLSTIEAWARPLGCLALWGAGRRGWARLVEPRGFARIADFDGQPAWLRRIA